MNTQAENAKSFLMRIATERIKELVEDYRTGFFMYEPDSDSMTDIERAAGQLWEAMKAATFMRAKQGLHYARRDKQFQKFMRQFRKA